MKSISKSLALNREIWHLNSRRRRRKFKEHFLLSFEFKKGKITRKSSLSKWTESYFVDKYRFLHRKRNQKFWSSHFSTNSPPETLITIEFFFFSPKIGWKRPVPLGAVEESSKNYLHSQKIIASKFQSQTSSFERVFDQEKSMTIVFEAAQLLFDGYFVKHFFECSLDLSSLDLQSQKWQMHWKNSGQRTPDHKIDKK